MDKMDRIMKAMKAVHSIASAGDSVSPEDLKRQREGQILFSKVATPVIGVKDEKLMIDDIPAEWVKPELYAHRRHIMLYCHGGGYTCGGLDYARVIASKLARYNGMDVMSFEYRLAPEAVYPAAIDDAHKVWNYLMQYGYGARDIILCGDSAGGNLALELCLKLKEEGRMLPKALVLFSPWTDMTCTAETYETRKDADPLLTVDYVKAVRGAYTGGGVDYSDPCYSPLFGDLSDFPPTLIQVGDNEILLHDSTELAERLKSNGTLTRLEVYKDGWHVFQQMPIPKLFGAMDSVTKFVQEIVI